MRLSSLRKQRPTLISMSWANTSPLLAMKQTYVTMSLLGLYWRLGQKHQIIGTTFKDGEVALNRLKQDMSQHTTDNLIFRDIVPLDIEGKRVLLFQIPASPRNIVMHWKGVAYGRDGESLKPLNQAKQDTIRQQPPIPDWTAQLVPNATINDLDELAVATTKVMFKKFVRQVFLPKK